MDQMESITLMEQLCNAIPTGGDNKASESVIGPFRPALLVKTFMYMNIVLIKGCRL